MVRYRARTNDTHNSRYCSSVITNQLFRKVHEGVFCCRVTPGIDFQQSSRFLRNGIITPGIGGELHSGLRDFPVMVQLI